MKISVLASGSKGNCTYIETKNHRILVDMGTCCQYIEQKLKEIDVDPRTIDSIFITHTHNDHISALKVFLKKYSCQVFLTEKMYDYLIDNCKINLNDYTFIDDTVMNDDLKVITIKTSHDVDDSNGYVFENDDKSIVYITDTGYINIKYFPLLENRNVYVFESNHDIEMLMNGKYTHDLKVRIWGDKGHLSNEQSAEYLSKLIGNKTKYVVLAHLSEENNTEEIAYETLTKVLNDNLILVDNVIVARQKERTELIEI